MSIRPQVMIEAKVDALLEELTVLTKKPNKTQNEIYQLHSLIGRIDSLGWVLHSNYRSKFDVATLDAVECLTESNLLNQFLSVEYQIEKGLIKKVTINETVFNNGSGSCTITFNYRENDDFFKYQRNGKVVEYKRLINALNALKKLGWRGEVMHIVNKKNSKTMTTLDIAATEH